MYGNKILYNMHWILIDLVNYLINNLPIGYYSLK